MTCRRAAGNSYILYYVPFTCHRSNASRQGQQISHCYSYISHRTKPSIRHPPQASSLYIHSITIWLCTHLELELKSSDDSEDLLLEAVLGRSSSTCSLLSGNGRIVLPQVCPPQTCTLALRLRTWREISSDTTRGHEEWFCVLSRSEVATWSDKVMFVKLCYGLWHRLGLAIIGWQDAKA